MTKVTDAHIESRRNQILDAAWQRFAREGYHRTTVEDIATEAGLSAGAIYRYFPGKEAVLRAIIDRTTERNAQLLEDVRADTLEPADALQAVGRAMFGAFDDPVMEIHLRLDIELRGESLRNEALRQSLGKQLVFWRTSMTNLLKEAQRTGQIRADVDAEAVIVLAICAYEGLRQWKLFDPGMFRPKEVYDLIMSLVALPPAAVGPDGSRRGRRPAKSREV